MPAASENAEVCSIVAFADCVDDAEDDSLVFGGREFLGGEHRHEKEHDGGNNRQADPTGVNGRARFQSRVELVAVPIAQTIEV